MRTQPRENGGPDGKPKRKSNDGSNENHPSYWAEMKSIFDHALSTSGIGIILLTIAAIAIGIIFQKVFENKIIWCLYITAACIGNILLFCAFYAWDAVNQKQVTIPLMPKDNSSPTTNLPLAIVPATRSDIMPAKPYSGSRPSSTPSTGPSADTIFLTIPNARPSQGLLLSLEQQRDLREALRQSQVIDSEALYPTDKRLIDIFLWDSETDLEIIAESFRLPFGFMNAKFKTWRVDSNPFTLHGIQVSVMEGAGPSVEIFATKITAHLRRVGHAASIVKRHPPHDLLIYDLGGINLPPIKFTVMRDERDFDMKAWNSTHAAPVRIVIGRINQLTMQP